MNFYCINLARDQARWLQAKSKFDAESIQVTRFNGWDNGIGGLRPLFPYEVDDPGSGYLMGEKQIGIYLSHWMLWNYLATLGDHQEFFIFEDDIKFEPGWKEQWRSGLASLPYDWDLFYVGNCCLSGWPDNVLHAPNIWKTKHAQCSHAYMVRSKALPFLLDKCQKVWAPLDLALLWQCQPQLNVFARLPRLISQEDTDLPP